MCHYIFVFLVAAMVAHLVPKQSKYVFQGVGTPNSLIEWSPQYNELHGMIFFHAIGNFSVKFDSTQIKVEDNAFFHTYGYMPYMHCESDSVCKVVAHLIT